MLLRRGFLGGSVVKKLPANLEIWFYSLGREDPLEKEMAIYSCILAWEIAEEAGRLQPMGLQKSWTYLSN